MAKTRTLPDKYYDKDYETNGIHRVPLWRIAGFALNNTATNLYLMFMNYVSFYLLGFVGVGMVMASSFTMAMRIWDGVTDPFIGYMVDKTNGKFGKNRPFMVIGNIILAASSFIMFHFTHKLPEGPARFIFFVVFCCVYYLGYTCQCVVTKSAQSCMTNDPKQRPMFASFDGVFNTILFTVLAIVVANIANKYADVGNYTSTQFFHEFWMMTAIISAIFTVTAVTTIPSVILTFLVISIVATRFGQKKAMVIGSIGGIICNVILSALWIVGDPTTMTSNPETGALNWGPFLITYVVFSILYAGCQGISGNIVIPMTADCADYEVYRSGKYVPGLMGTLFSFVDKMISSFAPMIAGLVFAACGFTDHNPSVGDIVTPQLRVGVVFLAYGLITIGLICNLIAMKFYPLSKEKMAEIQDEIVKIKAKAMAEA